MANFEELLSAAVKKHKSTAHHIMRSTSRAIIERRTGGPSQESSTRTSEKYEMSSLD